MTSPDSLQDANCGKMESEKRSGAGDGSSSAGDDVWEEFVSSRTQSGEGDKERTGCAALEFESLKLFIEL